MTQEQTEAIKRYAKVLKQKIKGEKE